VEKAYALWRAFQDRVLERISAILLLACTLLALLEIVRRYIFGQSFDWQADAVTYFTLAAVYLYFCISQRHGEHLTVTVITETLDAIGPRARHAADIMRFIASVIAFAFLVAMASWGIHEVLDSFRYETRTESLAFPMWPFLVVLVAGFAFMALTLFFQIHQGLHKLRSASASTRSSEEEVTAR
jgi:TRAP-type C4-dicarboxylate transport system permease small subunit